MKDQLRKMIILLIVVGVSFVVHPSVAEAQNSCGGFHVDPASKDWTNPSTGDIVGITIVVRFSELDTFPEYAIDMPDLDAFLNESGYQGHGCNGSVSDYFYDVSCGALNYTNTLFPEVFTSTESYSYYLDGPSDTAGELATEVVLWLDGQKGFDFSGYDANNDGVVDAINIFAQGPGAFNSGGLHSHFSGISSVHVDSLTVDYYQLSNIGTALRLGTFCHENGHMLCGWADYYNGDHGDLGAYCLMGTGFGLPNTNPHHPNAYLKMLAGWSTPIILSESQFVQAIHDTCSSAMIFHLGEGSEDSYIIENRQDVGRDAGMGESGLAIFKISAIPGYVPRLTLVEADNNNEPRDSGNLWAPPDHEVFDFSSSPAATWEIGEFCSFYLSNFSQSGHSMAYEFGFHDMVPVKITTEPEGIPAPWTMTGPGGFELSGVGEYDTSLGRTGSFTVEYSSVLHFGDPTPMFVTIDLSAVTDSCAVFSTQFNSPLVVEAGGDIGDPSSATTVCAVDFDNDGLDDLFIGNSDGNNLILLADGDGGFLNNSAPDILALAPGVIHAAWADIDNDGDMDVFLVRNNGEHMLLQNSSSNLIDITSQSPLFLNLGEVSSVAFNDVNRDGNLDCFVVHHDSTNELFWGDGTGAFILGNPGDTSLPFSDTDYSYWADFSEDGYSDVLVGSTTGQSKLYKYFEGELDLLGGVLWQDRIPSAPVWVDYNNDGFLDLIRFQEYGSLIALWAQGPGSTFVKSTLVSVDNRLITSINLIDFNNDGNLDLYCTVRDSFDLLYLNNADISSPGLNKFSLAHLPQVAGASVASTKIDANGDGAMDLYVVCDDGPNYLLYNNFYEQGNWIGFELESISQNAGAVGARVELYANNVLVRKDVSSSGGPGQNSSIIHFGIDDESSDRVAYVYWGGETEPTLLTDLSVNEIHLISEIGISEVAEYPILSGGSNNAFFAVHVEHGGSASVNVQADLTPLGGLGVVALLDDGVDPDISEGDGLFTSAPFSSSVTAGQDSVEVTVSGVFALPTVRSVSVEVIESQLLLVDGSGETGNLNQLSGEPYAGIYFDSPVAGSNENVLIVTKDASSDPEIFKQDSIVSGAPNMEKTNLTWFSSGGSPNSGSRGVYAADFDNDGDEDFFICHNNQETRLYENTGNGFSDVTIMFGGNESLLNGAHVAAWGDYNQDGKLDLFVATMNYTGSVATLADNIGTVTNSQWFLFKNTGTSFELALDSMYITGGFALSASWNDVNNDGLLDLVVGELEGGVNGSPTVILNQGYKKSLGHYLLTEDPGTAQITGLTVNSQDWIDYDHNNLPDLVVTEFFPNFGAHILKNTGNGFEVAVTLTSDGTWTGAVVADFNQDGQDDVVLLPLNGMPALFVGDQATNPTYKELAYPLGLRQGATSGGFAADFNDDKDLDLYLGRANTYQFLYKNQRVNGSDSVTGDQDWIRFDLTTMGNSNASLIGARITVVGDTKQWIQTVDGGSGRGGQRSNELHFGLGNATGSVDVILDWPGSIPPNPITYSSLAINTVHAIADTARPHVIVGSPEFLPEPSPTGADWVFEWRTVEHGNVELDQVEVDFGDYFPGDYCYVGLDMTLEIDTPDVEMTIFPVLPSGWKHRVVWSNQSCLGDSICGFQFKVGSGVESPQGVQTLTEGPWVNFGEFDVCITKKSITN